MIAELFTVFFTYRWTFLFYIVILILLFLNRTKFEMQGKLVALMRTKYGLKLMEKIASRYREHVKLYGYIGIGVGYVGLLFVSYKLVEALWNTIFVPGTVGASPVIPGVPIAGTGIVIPLVAGWLSLFIIMVVHEFSHGVVARAHKVRVKSSGIAFFGPILAAFVEPDEKQIEKENDIVQYSIFAAGPFSNIVLAGVVFLIAAFLLNPVYSAATYASGISVSPMSGFPAFESGMTEGEVIQEINGAVVGEYENFLKLMSALKPNESINIVSDKGNYDMVLAASPEDESKPYLGVKIIEQVRKPKEMNIFLLGMYYVFEWFRELMFWVFFFSFNIGLINLFPIFITDGARMLKVNFEKLVGEKERALRLWVQMNKLGLLMLLLLLFIPLLRWMFG